MRFSASTSRNQYQGTVLIQMEMEVGSHSKPIREPANPENLIDAALTEIFRVYPQSKVHFQYEFNHNHKVCVDILKINRVLSNIIGNAAQAMNFQGSMWFKTRELNQSNFVELKPMSRAHFLKAILDALS